jgi:hypothetical protein
MQNNIEILHHQAMELVDRYLPSSKEMMLVVWSCFDRPWRKRSYRLLNRSDSPDDKIML